MLMQMQYIWIARILDIYNFQRLKVFSKYTDYKNKFE